MILSRSTVHDYEVRDRKLPGHTFLDAIHNRQLMSWSDRGGASHLIGEQWAKRCDRVLLEMVGSTGEFGRLGSVSVREIIRLDDRAEVEREANRHQLENPDFFVIGLRTETREPVLFAADAKFAADRIKASQVSAETSRQLLEVPAQGAARTLLKEALANAKLDPPEIVDGLFLVPDASMTELLLARRNGNDGDGVADDEILRLDPEPASFFDGLPMATMIGMLARIDRLPVSPRQSLMSAVYYFRVACASHYLWMEEHRPLLGGESLEIGPGEGVVDADVAQRTQHSTSAYGMLLSWHRDLRRISRSRKAVKDAARLPVAMREIRDRVDTSGATDPKASIRNVRRDLEIAFREKLVDTVGVIAANDPRSDRQLGDEISQAARSLRPLMLELMYERVAFYAHPRNQD